MSPELIKYALIGFFVFLITVVIYEWSKTGFKLTKPDPNKPLFKRPSKEERNKAFKRNLVLGGVMLCVVFVLERCGVIS